LLTNQNLPKTEGEFFELLKLYFPNVYDVKYLMKSCKNLKGGLQVIILIIFPLTPVFLRRK
jgi:CCR4-NOT transcription complex subunit 7/8